VVLPSFTFVASANAVVTAGARCVFADIDYDPCCVDPAHVAALITPRTEAIMPVHYGGHAADMAALAEIASDPKPAALRKDLRVTEPRA
jgi:dTDP-4-amino-4,6-dideoxygalactose transaminase